MTSNVINMEKAMVRKQEEPLDRVALDIGALLDKAVDSPKGVKLTFETYSKCWSMQYRCYRAIVHAKCRAAKIYRGMSYSIPWDNLLLSRGEVDTGEVDELGKPITVWNLYIVHDSHKALELLTSAFGLEEL